MNWLKEVLENHLENIPNHKFLYDEQTSLTFKQVYDLSGKVYAYLKAKGIGREDFVLINLTRGVNPYIAIIGVWRAGAAFILTENTDPSERIKYIYNNCSCKLEINDAVWQSILKTEPLNGYENVDEHDAAYAVYTSGTTGNPKGVIHEYGNLKETYESHFYQGKYIFKKNDKVAIIAPLSSIASIILFQCALATEEPEIHIISRETVKSHYKLKIYLSEKQITNMFMTPSYLRSLSTDFSPFLKTIIMGAEPANGVVLPKNVTVYNSYAMSESGFAVCIFKIDKISDIYPIGCPQFNKKVYLLDKDGKEVKDGETGEICFDSPFVRGYVNLPQENIAFKDGIYHTSDLAKKLSDGNFVIVGRKSDMIKIYGNRVEPAEVEAAIRQELNIEWCAVKAFKENELEYLAAYYTDNIPDVNINNIREKLSLKLPHYMLPQHFVKIDKIPVNKTGKFDRKALPKPEFKEQEIIPPQTDFEKQVFDIISSELKTTDFGVTTNLISLGLTSIKAIKISALIKQNLNYSIDTGDILSRPYIREFIKFIDNKIEKIDILPKQKTYPLTSNQLGIFIDWERNKDSLQYNLPTLLKLDNVNPKKLLKSLKSIIDLHPYFKVHLKENENGEIVQERRDSKQISIVFEKLEIIPDKDFFQKRIKPFNLLDDNLSRFEIYYTNNTTYLFIDIHHIIFDGTSMNILLSELSKSYQEQELSIEDATAFDYALFYKNWLNSDDYVKSEEYFKGLVKDTTSFIYPPQNTDATGLMECFSAEFAKEKIQKYCFETGITENAFFATVLCQVFHRICRENTIQISTISSGRSLYQLSNSIGMFVQTLPLVSRSFKGRILDILKTMQEQIISTIKNEKYPYTELVEKYGVKPNVLYAYQGDVITSKLERIDFNIDNVKVPMSINIYSVNDTYSLSFAYDKGLYSREKIANLCKAIKNFANNIVSNPKEAEIQTIPLVSEQERKNLIHLGTGEKIDYDKTKTFVELFLNQVKQNPDKTAIIDYKSSITYQNLDIQSNIVAQELIKLGVKPNDFVVVKLPRIKEFMISVIGIWKAGAAYLPIDKEYPIERINYMIEDSESKVIIDEEFLSKIDFSKNVTPINLTTSDNLAYMIYTSGSTGKPKGVMIEQKNIIPFNVANEIMLQVEPSDVFAHYISFSFDGSLLDFISPILNGLCIHILNETIKTSLEELHNYIIKNNITTLTLPTQLGMEISNRYKNLPLKYLVIGGEKATNVEGTSFKIINAYGPTEFTVFSSYHIIDSKKDFDDIPIGRPVANSISAIVDTAGNLLPKGMIGELVLIGSQISQGYWNRPEITKERFVECPFIEGEMMYKTGDLVRWNENNELLYIGRTDNQVKMRGFRIELGEIEFVLSKIKGVKSCISDVKELNGIKRLIGYYSAKEEISQDMLKQELSKTLAEYMIPDIFVYLEKMPLTSNGKIDRKVLPIPELKSQEIVLPQTDFERQIFDIISNELKTTDFGVTTNLISMGLTSIKAIKISSLIKQNLNYAISTEDILSVPYIRELIKFTNNKAEKFDILPKQKTYPLTPNQLGIYLDWKRNQNSLQYNIPTALKLGNVEPEKLLKCLEQVIELHPYFKVHIKENENGEIIQERRDSEQLSIIFKKLETIPDKEFFQQRIKPFNLLNDDLSRFEIYYTNDTTYVFIDIHHIIFDGISLNVILSEIRDTYMGLELSSEKATAFDYSLFYKDWLNSDNYAKSEEYFKGLIKDSDSFMYPSIKTQLSGKCDKISGKVPKKDIHDYCLKLGITENVYFATILCQVFHRIGRNDNIQISTISNGRSIEELSNSIGMFVHTVPLVSNCSKGIISKIFKSMQEQVISTLKNEKYPYTELVEKFGIKPNIIYAYQGEVITSKLERIELKLNNAKVPLLINIRPDKDIYELSFEYDNGLYSYDEITNLCACVTNFANNIITASIDSDIKFIPLVSEKETLELVELGTGEKINYDKSKTFVDLFLNQVKENPAKTAIVDYKSSISYQDLDTQSNVVAQELINRGVKPNDFVVVKLPRTKEFMVSVIGIWKAGGAYLPVDKEYPIDRINYMIEDSESKVIVDEEFLSKIDFSKNVTPINLTTSDNLAYMIYTSGSTGKPKGVMISQSNLFAFIVWHSNVVKLKSQDNIAEHASFSFDGSCIDLYSILTVGGTLHILSSELRQDMRAMIEYFKTNHIRGCFLTTQLAQTLLSYSETGLEFLMLGGEKDYGFKPSKTVVFEGYGPTETTIYATCGIIDQTFPDINNIPIGRPLANSKCAVVDDKNNLIPRGMVGELVIIGPQVSKGYWKRPELTKEKFVNCPFIQGERMYKTGDLVRWNDNGEIIYIGRIDNQIKLRGFRIELGEIDSVLSNIEGIESCITDVKEINGIKHLIGYYAAKNEIIQDILKQELSKTLAEYMIPDIFVHLEKMPLTSNGKIDRKALPIPSIDNNSENFVEPVTETEKIICEVYGNILNVERFSAASDFFKAGGTSLTGIRVVAELQKHNLDVIYGDIFKYKTPQELAYFLEHSQEAQNTSFDFGDYDYTKINSLLQNTRQELFNLSETHPLGTILLTGATGFLGIHVLKYLLENTDSKIYLLVRSKKRIITFYEYYFNYVLTEKYEDRIIYIESDITDKNLNDKLRNIHYDTLFNCAASVKHYIADNELDKVNIDGVRNLMDCCIEHNAKMVQISSYSVAGFIEQNSSKVLDEQHLYVGQTTNNNYVRTKFLAERYLLEAIAEGKLKGKIMRLGNLMGREADGEFQINFKTNAFVNLLKSYTNLGVYPTAKLKTPVEMSPIDAVAKAVVKLATTPDDMVIFHPFNAYKIEMKTIFDAINKMGHSIDYVSDSEFSSKIDIMRNDPEKLEYLQGLLHYGEHNNFSKKFMPTENQWTTAVLDNLGFQWKQTDEKYLIKFVQFLDAMQVFSV